MEVIVDNGLSNFKESEVYLNILDGIVLGQLYQSKIMLIMDLGPWTPFQYSKMYLVWVSTVMHNPQQCFVPTLDVDGQMRG
jgi:hypothetical protein